MSKYGLQSAEMQYRTLARFYDQIHAGLTEDIPFALAAAARANGPILELGCGTGRLLWPLAQAGHEVVGLDNSAEMLAIAAEQAERHPTVRLIEADMSRFDALLADQSDKPFALVLLSYNTALHLTRPQLIGMLHSVKAHLAPNGRFIVDTLNPFWLANVAPTDDFEPERTLLDPETGQAVEQQSRIRLDADAQTMWVDWRLVKRGASGDHAPIIPTPYHYHFPHEWQLLLTDSGYKIETLAGDYDGRPFAESAERLIITAMR